MAALSLGRAPAVSDLEAQAVALLDRIARLEAVPGAARLQRRVESELDAVRGDDSSGSRLLGAANNLIAVEFELDVWAPSLIGSTPPMAWHAAPIAMPGG
ncbi:hypothetical protein EMIHUDRAFT_244002 [Emiliania huxleyi CCMP1516]|uniref:Uncharacterized protein n=2 Tax=Emiliania huxleyi TaxID=2903 RepID=A0A0D3J221_EMIH1|nr:hypothetical protein EMIHUDRAFT_244002 [Emiliania huxleyi CCMP1516]EOD17556.1 hypothetical protein EMIHUDRAFT_244002 [Emiliania huxleyi CCMP1516]|eukprot:XP_005769985.1 hypothetical protein EMIHUDRAFT_244002 [Emiliania huxleyi CCMP1516]